MRAGNNMKRPKPLPKFSISKFKNFVIVFLLLLATVELSGAVWGHLTYNRIVYTTAGTPPEKLASAYNVPGHFFHPYLGYALTPGRTGKWLERDWRVNNAGFHGFVPQGVVDYPYRPAPDEIIVGIFGGSVGSGIAMTAQLSEVFAKQSPPQWHGKKVKVLNFALPGYRQPQQLFTFQYFAMLGQHFDAVINIDGFNEVVTGPKNNSDKAEWSYPADSLWGAAGRQLESVARKEQNTRETWTAQGIRAANAYANACRLGICILWSELMKAVYRNGPIETNSLSPDNQKTAFPVSPLRKINDEKILFTALTDLWVSSSISMSDLANRLGAPYVHLLQPNQWYRRFGDYAPINQNHIYDWVIGPVNTGYDSFRARIPALSNAGVAFVDASGIFEGQDWRKNYSDDCCHYTTTGYNRLHLSMIDAISKQLAAAAVKR